MSTCFEDKSRSKRCTQYELAFLRFKSEAAGILAYRKWCHELFQVFDFSKRGTKVVRASAEDRDHFTRNSSDSFEAMNHTSDPWIDCPCDDSATERATLDDAARVPDKKIRP